LLVVREHVISRPDDLQAFYDIHPLHSRYGGEMAYLLGDYVQAIKAAGFNLDKVLRPLRSPVNYGPGSVADLRTQIARRAAGGLPALGPALASVLSIPVLWSALLPLLELADHRPGRLFSFLAHKP
jgi:hypothetical protein